MPRIGGFPESQPFDPEAVYESTAHSGSEVVRKSLPPGPERDAALAEILDALKAGAGDMSELIHELRDLMAGRDLTQLINSVVVPAMMVAFSEEESLADGGLTSSWASKVEYLVGIALSVDPTGNAKTPAKVTRRVSQLVSDIFEADQLRMITSSIDNADSNGVDRGLLQQQLQLEYQADRMPGYAVHLEQVDAEVFGRHRDYYLQGLGFDPADVIRATRLHARWLNETFTSGRETFANAVDNGELNPEAHVEWLKVLAEPKLWVPEDVAAITGIAAEQVTAMLEFFSTEYGCQPEFRAPSDPNRARTHPCIKLGDSRYFVPDPWSLSAVVHQRLATTPKSGVFDPEKYFKHRQDAHERLVAGALETVFGDQNVHSGQHYDLASAEHGEVDSLVCAGWPLAVEAKAIALTEAGRRGAPRRVDTKLKTILGKALSQTDRALTYILDEGGRSFASTENGRPVELLPDDVPAGTAIIVTFERIDPFASGGLAAAGNVNRPTWVVSLTDLLMVTDILTDAAAFHHYARTRAGMHDAGASVGAEADALGAYLEDRLRIVDQSALDEPARILIGYSCAVLNDFYTRQELGQNAPKPRTEVPEEVTDALAVALRQPGWAECVDAVMSADSAVWKKWKRFRGKRRRGGTFVLNDQVSLVSMPNGERSFERVGQSVRLSIPTTRGSAVGSRGRRPLPAERGT